MTKIGEVFKLIDPKEHRYFQLVSFDMTQLNSDVIAVFNYKDSLLTPLDASSFDDLKKSGVEFFTHTTVSAGPFLGLWEKIGKFEAISDSKALFKDVDYTKGWPEVEPYEVDHYDNWVIWSIGKEWVHIGSRIDKYPNAELGAVYPPVDVVYRIKHGEYPGVAYYGFKR